MNRPNRPVKLDQVAHFAGCDAKGSFCAGESEAAGSHCLEAPGEKKPLRIIVNGLVGTIVVESLLEHVFFNLGCFARLAGKLGRLENGIAAPEGANRDLREFSSPGGGQFNRAVRGSPPFC